MKIMKIILVPSLLFLACNLLARDDESASPRKASKQWKVTFFKEYMAGYKALPKPDHASISRVLQDSFAKAIGGVPDQDKELAAGVNDQVCFFVELKDPAIIEREVKKCTDGMKEANGAFAKFAPTATKARIFVDRFYKEYKKRKKIEGAEEKS